VADVEGEETLSPLLLVVLAVEIYTATVELELPIKVSEAVTMAAVVVVLAKLAVLM
jgi:hypothetical protein